MCSQHSKLASFLMFHFRLRFAAKEEMGGVTHENRGQFLEDERPAKGCLSRETGCPNRQVYSIQQEEIHSVHRN